MSKPVMDRRREIACLFVEQRCVDFYRACNKRPDGAFMRSVFRKGYEAALRDKKKSTRRMK